MLDHVLPAIYWNQRDYLVSLLATISIALTRLADYQMFSYAPTIFGSLGLNASTTSLLATGVLGIVDFIFTFPAIFWVDRFGRRIFFMAGALGMMISHIVVAGIVGHYDGNFKVPGGVAAGWIGVVFIYVRFCPLSLMP